MIDPHADLIRLENFVLHLNFPLPAVLDFHDMIVSEAVDQSADIFPSLSTLLIVSSGWLLYGVFIGIHMEQYI